MDRANPLSSLHETNDSHHCDWLCFLFITLGLGIAAINTGNNLQYLILGFMLSMIVVSGILSERNLRGLKPVDHTQQNCFANHNTKTSFALANQKTLIPTFALRANEIYVKEDFPECQVTSTVFFLYIPPANEAKAQKQVSFPERGRYLSTYIQFETHFPFGFLKKIYEPRIHREYIVYPELIPIASDFKRKLKSLAQSRDLVKGDGENLSTLRPYQPGDSLRLIDWKKTARLKKTYAKEFEVEANNTLTFYLELSGYTATSPSARRDAERLLSQLASLANFCQDLGLHFTVLSNIGLCFKSTSSASHLFTLYSQLAKLNLKTCTYSDSQEKRIRRSDNLIYLSSAATLNNAMLAQAIQVYTPQHLAFSPGSETSSH